MSFTRALRAVGAAAAAGSVLFAAAPTASADQVRNDQWPLAAFAADKVWSVATGKGVTVAVIDNGFKTDHVDLAGQFLEGKDFIDGDTSVEPDPEGDNPGHGTAMAGIIAGHGHGAGRASGVKGLAPEAKILPIRDNGSSGSGYYGPAIRYAVDHGADVINISQGAGSGDDGDVLLEQRAIKYAVEHGVPVVTASGNDGKEVAESDIKYPAVEPGVVTVGAVESTTEIWNKSDYGPELMLAAPGVKNVVAGLDADGYNLGNGTSDSSAYTSATLALLKQKFPDLSAGQLVNRLVKTAGLPASAQGKSLPDEHYGYGFIKPYSALTKDIPAGPKSGPLKIDELNSAIAKGQSSTSSAPSSSSPGDTSSSSDSSDSGGMSTGLIIAIAAGVLVILVIVVVLIARSKKNNGSGPPPPPGGGWNGGGNQPYPGPYQQQAPPAPGAYPQAPSQPPYGQQ
ncbi:S8 family serine peptidase [Streptomyces sp. NPDC046716]|uniref:S8 family serine peptidase n=1 Tax=Streptomyces sp. NPDC046716 TaxID=3157093 RepID=UPI0033E9234D